MGRPNSSSKKKSSKKKIPKISSEARRKKRSRKIKSKKLSGRDESISSYSDDDLSSSLSVSSSSSEDDYRGRKSRSHKREVKGSRKRARRSSSSRGGTVDSPRIKKKKRNGDSESKKKLLKKKKSKKRKRDSSISSVSSDTHSCSTCQGESDSGSERPRERSREKKSKRKSGKGRSITRKSRDRSISVSFSRKLSDSVYNNPIELFAVENNSRRLRSVITVFTREKESEGNEENKDEFKEEIIYDHDDYPSCRSNDSNEAGNKTESAHRTMENVIGEDPSVSNLKASDPIFTSKNGSDKYEELKCSSDGASNVSPKEKESDVKDLELILRQRALENLKRFKGGHQIKDFPVDEKTKNENENELLSNIETEIVPNKRAVENKKISQGGSHINEVVPLDERNKSNNEMKPEDPGVIGASESSLRRSRFTWKRDSSFPTGTEEKIPPKKNGGTDSVASKLKDATLRHLGLPSGSGEKARNVRPLASRLQTLPRVKSSMTDSTVDKSVHKRGGDASQTLAESSSNTCDIGTTNDASGTTALETPSVLTEEGEGSLRKQQNDTKDASQFEQKTMTVMRGGELVQVNYKVYIPKKVPALARRQLKR